MDIHSAWEKALRETNIVRSRITGLQTFSETHVPYILLSPSSINEGDTVVRTGEVLVHRPSLILPPNIPQLEGFDFDGKDSFKEDTMINFLMVRGITLPSMKYDNKISSLNVFEGKIERCYRPLRQPPAERREHLCRLGLWARRCLAAFSIDLCLFSNCQEFIHRHSPSAGGISQEKRWV